MSDVRLPVSSLLAAALFFAPLGVQAARPVVAVFALQSDGTALKAKDLERLSDYIGATLTASGRYQVVPKAELKAALNAKKKASYKQCYAESCQIEIGKELAAEKTLAGTVSRFGKRCIVTLHIVDLAKATQEAAGTGKGACTEDDVLTSLDAALAQLAGGALGPRTTAPAVQKSPKVQGGDYGDLDAEIAQAAKAAGEVAAAKMARTQAARKDWKKLQRYLKSERLPVQRRIQIVEKFLSTFGVDNPYAAQAQEILQVLSRGVDMVSVPAGTFNMGCNKKVDAQCEADEKPGKQLHLPTFHIDTTEVTVAAYRKCVRAGACSDRGLEMPFFSGKPQSKWAWACNWNKTGRAEHPVNCVDWAQAAGYCRWLGKRLPSEREWEKAARGTDGRRYTWGNRGFESTRYANIADKSARRANATMKVSENYDDGYYGTAPVAHYPAGKSPYGAHDMVGNVREWVADWYTSGKKRSVRGGSWYSLPKYARTSNRHSSDPQVRSKSLGFRCAK